MPSLIASASILGRTFSSLVGLNPWTWVALIYALQTLGALIVIHVFRLSFVEVAPAIMLLIFGISVAMVFRWYDPLSALGSWKWWIPAGIYVLFIFSLSSRSYPEAHAAFSTRLFHPIEYFTLGVFLSGACHKLLKEKGASLFILSVQLSGILFAVSDELHQAFVPGRTARLSDVFIDSVSVALGCGIFWVLRHTRTLRNGRLSYPPQTETENTQSPCESKLSTAR